ncbi:MAG TPA: hypothetical protein VGL86_20050 [Polyangia bacterium]|jgi:hypothetical protein
MRNLAFALLVVAAAALGACSAIDDFTKFKFSDGGEINTDMGGANLPDFGQACVDDCAPGAGAAAGHPLTCMHNVGSRTLPGGMCTRACTPGVAGCIEYGANAADCVTIEGVSVCLPHCDSTLGRNCRTNYSCCSNMSVVTTAGDCAPSNADICH